MTEQKIVDVTDLVGEVKESDIAPYTGEFELKPVPVEQEDNDSAKDASAEEGKGKEKVTDAEERSEAERVMEETKDIQGDFDYKDILTKDKRDYSVKVVTEALGRVDSIKVPRAKELEELDAKDKGSNWRIALYIQICSEELHPDNRGRHKRLVQSLGKIINKFLSSVKVLSPGDVEKILRIGGCMARLIALKPPKRDGNGRKITVTDGARRKCEYYYQVMIGNRNFMREEFTKAGIDDELDNMKRLEHAGWIFHADPVK
jgi:hypothetical protein